jgi:hypothetical protein
LICFVSQQNPHPAPLVVFSAVNEAETGGRRRQLQLIEIFSKKLVVLVSSFPLLMAYLLILNLTFVFLLINLVEV